MGMKASEVGDWLRQRAGKGNHCEVLSGDYVVIRPGPSFHLLNRHRHLNTITRVTADTKLTTGPGDRRLISHCGTARNRSHCASEPPAGCASPG
jgi:hypothetical protein